MSFKYKKSDLVLILLLVAIMIWISRPIVPKQNSNLYFRELELETKALTGDTSAFFGLFSRYLDMKSYDKCFTIYDKLIDKGYEEEASRALQHAFKTSKVNHSEEIRKKINKIISKQ